MQLLEWEIEVENGMILDDKKWEMAWESRGKEIEHFHEREKWEGGKLCHEIERERYDHEKWICVVRNGLKRLNGEKIKIPFSIDFFF